MGAPQHVIVEPVGEESFGTVISRHGRCRYEGYPKVGGRRMVRADEGCLPQGFIECHEAHEVGTAFVWRGGKGQSVAHFVVAELHFAFGKLRVGGGKVASRANARLAPTQSLSIGSTVMA